MVLPAAELARLTVAERLALIDRVWASLRGALADAPPELDEAALLRERLAAHVAQPDSAVVWSNVREQLELDQRTDESDRGNRS